MIGKWQRSTEVLLGMKKYSAVYFAAIGGDGIFIAKAVVSFEIAPEAIYILAVVATDRK